MTSTVVVIALIWLACFLYGMWRQWVGERREQRAVASLRAKTRIVTREHEDEMQRIWRGRHVHH